MNTINIENYSCSYQHTDDQMLICDSPNELMEILETLNL